MGKGILRRQAEENFFAGAKKEAEPVRNMVISPFRGEEKGAFMIFPPGEFYQSPFDKAG